MDLKSAGLILWQYLQIKQTPKNVDCMIVLGSNDDRVASYAAELMLKGFAKTVIFSGASGRNTEGLYATSEANHFASIALKMGVNESSVLIEDKATNTGDNISLSLKLLANKNISANSFMLVQKNAMGRRALATFQVYEPTKEVLVCCPDLTFDNYLTDAIDLPLLLNTMVADLERIIRYPKLGYQIKQEIPDEVLEAYEFLVDNGFSLQV